jgi:hypothetical protein
MTHDELLGKLLVTDKTNMDMEVIKWQLALWAVVELHKPSLKDYKNEIGCVGCDINSEWATWNEEYPCPTIQAIEKELR